MISQILLVRVTYIWVLFFTHILFMVNCTFNTTLTERLQHCKWFNRIPCFVYISDSLIISNSLFIISMCLCDEYASSQDIQTYPKFLGFSMS